VTSAACARLICATLAAAAPVTGAVASASIPRSLPPGSETGLIRMGQYIAQYVAQDVAPRPGPNEKPVGPVNTIQQVFQALEACWLPPKLDQGRPGMKITVLLSFTRKGEILGRPKITYESPGASEDERLAYRIAMAEALRRCNPLPFTDGLGNALAGRPMTIRFIDNRKLKQAENVHD
jgi:hypothetical protein